MLQLIWLSLFFVRSTYGYNCTECIFTQWTETMFCHVSYSICAIDSLTALDNLARKTYQKVVEESKPLSPQCLSAIRKVECAKHFEKCDVQSRETVSICTSSCKQVCPQNIGTAECIDAEQGNNCFVYEDSAESSDQWVLGVSISVLFSFLSRYFGPIAPRALTTNHISIGINLQRKALKQSEIRGDSKPVYQLPLWLIGFFLILVGAVLDLVAFGLAPQSMLAPLAALTLVWNMMLAPCFNAEKLDRIDIAATLIIFTGATLAVGFASHDTPEYNLEDLIELYNDPTTLSYFLVVFVVACLHFGALHLVTKRQHVLALGQSNLWSRVHLISYTGLAGIMGGQSVLCAKSCAELAKSVARGENCFKSAGTYLIFLGLLLFLCAQVHFLNGALRNFDALSVVPIYQAYWIISGVLGGVIYFQEIRNYSIVQSFLFVLGIIITIAGVGLLSLRKNTSSNNVQQRPVDTKTRRPSRQYISNYLDMSPRFSVSRIIEDLHGDKPRVPPSA